MWLFNSSKWHLMTDTSIESDILWQTLFWKVTLWLTPSTSGILELTLLESDILLLTFPQQVTFYDWPFFNKWHFMTDAPSTSDILWLTLLQQVTFYDWHSFNKWLSYITTYRVLIVVPMLNTSAVDPQMAAYLYGMSTKTKLRKYLKKNISKFYYNVTLLLCSFTKLTQNYLMIFL